MRGAGSIDTKEAAGFERKGKWTDEEEEFATYIVQYYQNGLLDLPQGSTLRTYLSDLLRCDPMRVTKKFAGKTRLTVKRRVSNSSQYEELTARRNAARHLEVLEYNFLSRARYDEEMARLVSADPRMEFPRDMTDISRHDFSRDDERRSGTRRTTGGPSGRRCDGPLTDSEGVLPDGVTSRVHPPAMQHAWPPPWQPEAGYSVESNSERGATGATVEPSAYPHNHMYHSGLHEMPGDTRCRAFHGEPISWHPVPPGHPQQSSWSRFNSSFTSQRPGVHGAARDRHNDYAEEQARVGHDDGVMEFRGVRPPTQFQASPQHFTSGQSWPYPRCAEIMPPPAAAAADITHLPTTQHPAAALRYPAHPQASFSSTSDYPAPLHGNFHDQQSLGVLGQSTNVQASFSSRSSHGAPPSPLRTDVLGTSPSHHAASEMPTGSGMGDPCRRSTSPDRHKQGHGNSKRPSSQAPWGDLVGLMKTGSP